MVFWDCFNTIILKINLKKNKKYIILIYFQVKKLFEEIAITKITWLLPLLFEASIQCIEGSRPMWYYWSDV